jgi:hypothetical protein
VSIGKRSQSDRDPQIYGQRFAVDLFVPENDQYPLLAQGTAARAPGDHLSIHQRCYVTRPSLRNILLLRNISTERPDQPAQLLSSSAAASTRRPGVHYIGTICSLPLNHPRRPRHSLFDIQFAALVPHFTNYQVGNIRGMPSSFTNPPSGRGGRNESNKQSETRLSVVQPS